MRLDDFLEIKKKDDKTPFLPRYYDANNPFGRVGVMNPITVIDGKKIRIHEVVMFLIQYYKPPPAVIYDPTCGKENHQFSPWLQNGYLEELGYTYISSDIREYGDFTADVLGSLPLRNESVDIIIYDPPYTTYSRRDKRGIDYDIANERTVKEVMKYYSSKVFREMYRILKKDGVLVVKGTDFYHTVTSDNFVLFIEMLEYKEFFRPIALYIYRYYISNLPLYRSRLKDRQRPLVVHTYYMVFRPRKT